MWWVKSYFQAKAQLHRFTAVQYSCTAAQLHRNVGSLNCNFALTKYCEPLPHQLSSNAKKVRDFQFVTSSFSYTIRGAPKDPKDFQLPPRPHCVIKQLLFCFLAVCWCWMLDTVWRIWICLISPWKTLLGCVCCLTMIMIPFYFKIAIKNRINKH